MEKAAAAVVRNFDHSPTTREVAVVLGVCFATAEDRLFRAKAHGLVSEARGVSRGMGQGDVRVWVSEEGNDV